MTKLISHKNEPSRSSIAKQSHHSRNPSNTSTNIQNLQSIANPAEMQTELQVHNKHTLLLGHGSTSNQTQVTAYPTKNSGRIQKQKLGKHEGKIDGKITLYKRSSQSI